jgi:RecJ-like exonuclease
MQCEICGGISNTKHHKFPQYKLHKKLYPEFIHHAENLVDLCIDCHLNGSVPHMTEREFCEHFGIEIRSKSGRGIGCKI